MSPRLNQQPTDASTSVQHELIESKAHRSWHSWPLCLREVPRIGIKTAMIGQKDYESRDLIAIRGTKLGRTQLTATTRQHLFGHLVGGFSVEPKNEGNHCRIDQLQGLGASD